MKAIKLFGCLVSVLLAISCTQLHKQDQSPDFKLLEQGEGGEAQSGVADKGLGDRLTHTEFNAVKNTADTADALATVNQGKLAIIEAITGLVFSDADGTYTDLSGISAAEIGYLNNVTSSIQTQLDAKEASADMATDVPANETDPVVGAINGIVVSNGVGGITAGVPGLNYAGITVTTSDPDPTTDDVTLYNNGQIWVNTTDERTWTLYDNTDGAAIWHMYGQNPVIVNGSISGNTQFEPGKTHTLTVGGDFTLSVNWSANAGAQVITFIITGNATNSITWPTTLWSLSTAPTQPFAASPQIIQFMSPDSGTTVYGFEVGSDMATP